MEQSSVLLIGIVALAIGAVIGYLMGRPGEEDTRDEQIEALQKELEAANNELNSYRDQVNGHFARTAELVNNLTESYREVHQHLASSAQQLCKDGEAARSLEAAMQPRLTDEDETVEKEIPVVTDTVASNETDTTPEPPRDYAPKKDNEEGTLSETYGLHEKAEPVPQSPADLVDTPAAERKEETKDKA
ncbi:MAG: YhcB family protein [Marinobacterium sp.]|nr:YhcB family protein [Marinobacterium sp.]